MVLKEYNQQSQDCMRLYRTNDLFFQQISFKERKAVEEVWEIKRAIRDISTNDNMWILYVFSFNNEKEKI